MKKFCRIFVYLLVWLLVFLPSFSSARSKFWQDKWTWYKPVVEDPTIDDEKMETIAQGTHDTIYDKLQWVLRFQEREEYSTTLWYAVSLVQVAINWILWILAFVALAYMLYSWFLVLSSWADDSKAKKGRKWISTAAIALAWIWLSWLIVSAMIWFITFLSESK